MHSRTAFTIALIPATLAAHLLVAACGGSEGTSQAGPGAGGSGGSGGDGAAGGAAVTTGAGVTTGSATMSGSGSGSGGNVPECMCAPKDPTPVDVACDVKYAKLDLPGYSAADLRGVTALGTLVPGNWIAGAKWGTAPVIIGDGFVAVECVHSSSTLFMGVTFMLPPQIKAP